jgi:hypothetical protein
MMAVASTPLPAKEGPALGSAEHSLKVRLQLIDYTSERTAIAHRELYTSVATSGQDLTLDTN